MVKLNKKQHSAQLEYRLGNHRLPVATGGWENTPLDERKCNLCTKQDIGDEFHYLFICNYFQAERKQFLKSYFYKRPNVIKFKELFSTDNVKDLIQLSKFVDIIIKKFSCHLSTLCLCVYVLFCCCFFLGGGGGGVGGGACTVCVFFNVSFSLHIFVLYALYICSFKPRVA